MATRSRDMKTQMVTRIVIILAILVVISLLSLGNFLRADLTTRKEFTVSDSSRTVLRELDDIVSVTAYMSDNLPQHMMGFRTRISDVLDEYRAYGGDRFRVTYTDPSGDPETERKVQMLGIHPIQLQSLEKDRAEVVNAYLGMSVMFEDRQEVIPVILDAGRLEYDLTGAIIKVMTTETPTVAFLTGHGEQSMDGEYSAVAEELRNHYNLEELSLSDGAPVPDGITTIIVPGPRAIPDSELYALDQFIMRGGKALFLVDGIEMPQTGMTARPLDSNVGEFLANYGARVNKDLVVDRVNSNANFQSGFMTLSMPYPYWPKVIGEKLSRVNPVVSDLDALVFPWTSSVELPEELPDGVEAIPLATSSAYSWTMPAFADLNPRQQFLPPSEAAETVITGKAEGEVLAAALTGTFTSAFADRPAPAPPEGEAVPGRKLTTSAPTQIIVMGNSRMFGNGLLRQLPSNFVFFLNSVDWLTHGEKLIGIRSKAVQDRPLREVSDGQKATIKFLATFGVPILVVVFGLIRTTMRRKRRTMLAEYLSA